MVTGSDKVTGSELATSESAEVIVFTAYQRPRTRGYTFDVLIDGVKCGRIHSGSFQTFQVEPGVHMVEIHQGKMTARADNVETVAGPPSLLVAGIGTELSDVSTSGGAPKKIWVELCSSVSQLPKCCIPLTSPTGKSQSLEQGRRNALIAAILMQLVALLLLVLGIAIIVGALSHAPGYQLGGLLLAATGLWVTFRMVKVFRLIISQWRWPFPDWRAESKSEAMAEWKRWIHDPES
jgi:hypothetical protein